MKKEFLNNSNVFFPKRLLLTLIAGENAGGDKRGCMSAAIEYFKPNRRIMTLRIDYSNNPLKDLSNLHDGSCKAKHREFYICFLQFFFKQFYKSFHNIVIMYIPNSKSFILIFSCLLQALKSF